MARDGKTKNRDHPAPTTVSIDTLTSSDLSRIVEIEKGCYRYPWSRESFREVLADPTFQTVAGRTTTGTLVGYIIFTEVLNELHVLNVAVHPLWQGRRIASFLLEYLHSAARVRGCEHAYLEVRESNRTAQDLYKKFGYRPIGRRMEYYPEDREDAIVMIAPIAERKD